MVRHMIKMGDFWIPVRDAAAGRNLEKSRAGFESGNGIQIAHLERALQWVPCPREVAIDGGANVGAWARLMAQHFRVVHAFEPNPEAFCCLRRNVDEWELGGVVILHEQALSSEDRLTAIHLKRGARTVTGRIGGDGGIECVTLDSLNLRRCSFLKLDLEGHEARALAGARNTVRRCKPWILVENKTRGRREGAAAAPVEMILAEYGYTLVEKIGVDGIDWLFRPLSDGESHL